MEHSQEKKALIAGILGQSIFGFSFMFSKIALDITTPEILLAVRFIVAFLIMNLLVIMGKIKIHLKGKSLKWILLLGLIQPVCYFLCESYGMKYSTSSFAGVIISLVPIASLILAVVVLSEKPTRKQTLFAILSVVGVMLTAFGKSEGSSSFLGFIFLLGAVLMGASSAVLNRKISGQFSTVERTYVMMGMGCVAFTCTALFQTRGDMWNQMMIPLTSVPFWVAILYLSGLSSVVAFLFLNYSMTYLPIARASALANLVTLISIFAGVIFLKESFTFFQLFGSVIIMIGVYGVNRSSGTLDAIGEEEATAVR